MARCYSDDLRRKLLGAYDRGEGTLTQLAARFSVSVGWARKISSQRKHTGQAERVPHRPGRKLRASEEVQQQVKAWFRAQPDLTLAEVQARLLSEAAVPLSIPQVWYLVRRLGLRLKKSHSTPPSVTAKPTSSGGKSISRRSGRSRRRS